MRGLVVTTTCCLAVAAASDHHQHSSTSAPLPSGSGGGACSVTGPMLDAMHDRYHSDKVCDRAEFNRFKASFDRAGKAQALAAGNRHELVPNERTVHCPAHVQSLYPTGEELVTGFDRSWIVENTASTPVVVLWVDPEDLVEKSAFSDTVPPTMDPEAVLSPGEWTVVSGFEGHVFNVREIMPDGTMGRVLLQHRLGWVAVGARLTDQARLLVCPDVDEPPVLGEESANRNNNHDSDNTGSKTSGTAYHPDFARTPPSHDRHCNRQDVGFRNALGCPVHGFYLEEDTCDEVFKMHLGVAGGGQQQQVLDFMDDWTSRTKFEATYSGHAFVFRSAHTGAEVDRVTIRPTSVTDCPDEAQSVWQRSTTGSEGLAVVRLEGDSVRWNSNNSTPTRESLWNSMASVPLPYSAIKTQGAQR
jgi:hypothetical protein